MNKRTKQILTVLGLGGVAAGIWYFTRPDAPQINNTYSGSSPLPVPVIPAGPAVPNNTPPAPTLYPVIGGNLAKVGDNLYAAGTSAGIYKTASASSKVSNQVIPAGNRAGEVIDISQPGFIKMRMYTGAPVWDNAPHYEFFIPKYNLYTVR